MQPRGTGEFDAAALREVLRQLDDGVKIDTSLLSAYRSYYGLEFPHITHRHEMYCLQAAGARLVVQYFIPSDARSHVLLCHGYYDHVGLFTHAIDYLLRRGIAVVTYDQIGHGLSSGAPAVIDDFDRYVAATHAVYHAAREHLAPESDEVWHWLGQSMGGAIVMEYLHQHPPAEGTGEIVLLAPLVRPYAWWINRWVFAIAKHTIVERPRTLANNAENAEFHALQEIDPLQARVLPVAWVQAMVDWYQRFERYPTSELAPRLVQGDDDHTVDWRYSLRVFTRRYPASTHLIIAKGRHHLANESAHIRQQMWAFLDENCAWTAQDGGARSGTLP